jgi:hypothetical protein
MNRNDRRELHKRIKHMDHHEFSKWLDDYANDVYHLAAKHAELAMEFCGIGEKRQVPIAEAWKRAIMYDNIPLREEKQA